MGKQNNGLMGHVRGHEKRENKHENLHYVDTSEPYTTGFL